MKSATFYQESRNFATIALLAPKSSPIKISLGALCPLPLPHVR